MAPNEQKLFGFTHAELGAIFGTQWSYPDSLISVVLEHESDEPASDLAALVRVADLLVREHGVGIEAPLEVPSILAGRLGLDLEHARARVAELVGTGGRDSGETSRMASTLESFA